MNTREAAQRYIDAGLRPIPVWPPSAGCRCSRGATPATRILAACTGQCLGKVPKDPEWKDRRPFSAHEFEPGDNLALAMGLMPDGRWLVALDTDGELPLERLLGPLPETMRTRSGRGEHRIYQVPAAAPLGNWVDALATRDKERGYKPGFSGALDLRYARGAVVAAPSLHRSGRVYETSDAPIAPLPGQAMAALLNERRRRGLPVEAYWRREGRRP